MRGDTNFKGSDSTGPSVSILCPKLKKTSAALFRVMSFSIQIIFCKRAIARVVLPVSVDEKMIFQRQQVAVFSFKLQVLFITVVYST